MLNFIVPVSWISFCISSVISIHFLWNFCKKLCLKIKKKDIFESLHKLFLKDVSNYFTRRFIHHENPLFTWKVHCLHIHLLQV